jgi:hypothetical protein
MVILLLAIAFAGILGQGLRLAYGTPARTVTMTSQAAHIGGRRLIWPSLVAGLPLGLVIVLFGLHLPGPVNDLLVEVARVLAPIAGEGAR